MSAWEFLPVSFRRSLSTKINTLEIFLTCWSEEKHISSTCWSFWLTIYLLSLEDVFFNRQSAYLWGTYCAPLLADLFLYSYEADFMQGLLRKNEKKLARSSNFTFRYINYVLSLDNSRFGDFVDRIYPIELEIKDTTDTDGLLHTVPWGHYVFRCVMFERKSFLRLSAFYLWFTWGI